MFPKAKKLISMLIVFVITFTYMGQTLEAVANSTGLAPITNGFFGNNSDLMKFMSYFVKDGEQITEKVSDINEKTTMILEISPNEIGKGFLKEGTITAGNLDEKNANFKFTEIKNIITEEPEQETDNIDENNSIQEEPEESVVENIVEEEENVVENTVEENIAENTVEPEESVEENTAEQEESMEENTAEQEESIEENTVEQEENIAENIVEPEESVSENIVEETNVTLNEVISRTGESREKKLTDELVNEEAIIEDEVRKVEEEYQKLTAKDLEIEIINDNQIKVQNIIYNTKIEVEIEYLVKDNFKTEDVYRENQLKLEGTYIDLDLDKKSIETTNTITVGWDYNKEFDFTSEYTKFSPFKLGESAGIIVENKVVIKRETEDENYLPVKRTIVEVDVPEYNGKLPETVNVQASKLMATKGEDVGEVNFDENNWKYDAENKKLLIEVINEKEGNAVLSKGEDEFIIVYRYNDYTEDEKVSINNKVKVMQENYSSNNNVTITKELDNLQEIQTKINDLITYNIATTNQKVSKAPINANYNMVDALHEAEFTTTVNVNILTSDLLEELKINSSKEIYVDNNSVEFDASQDIYYNKVKFNYSEISNMLKDGAIIELQTVSGDILYTLNKDIVTNQESSEIKLASKTNGIIVVFKNVTVNGNVSIEFTKAIGKSNYEKAVFNNFSKIKSCVSAELKYKQFDEKFAMSEIVAVKELEKSKTVAELSLTNNNLSTLVKNDSVEARIVLNNDKQDTDLYVNPSFELVFPRYVKSVTVENISMIYGMGLEIADFQAYTQDDIIKLKIDLKGAQTEFSKNVISNGTNILLTLNIELDEYTPKKQDQIKMYYCNEGVTNYESQTKWTISKEVPSGIIKDTNGFDVAIVNYQAPAGMITSNAIINYDGQASKINSLSHGGKKVEVNANSKAQIATMELVAMNNTGNVCSDVVFLGRIPFAGNKSVVTNNDLGTTVNTKLMNGINEDIKNANMATIYYSTNENATMDLENIENAWTKNVINWQNIRSYMIVLNGQIPAGNTLKYTYEFEIPENLDYEQSMYGSFGAFYNNNYESTISYESAEADKIGIITTKRPVEEVAVEEPEETSKIEIEFESTIKEKQKVGEEYQYRIIINNNLDMDLENASIDLYLNPTIDYEYSTVSRIEPKEPTGNEEDEGGGIVYVTNSERENVKEDVEIKDDKSATYKKEDNIVNYKLDTFKKGERIYVTANVKGIIEDVPQNVYAVLNSKSLEKSVSSEQIPTSFYNVDILIEEVPGNLKQIIEGNEINLKYKIKNIGEQEISKLDIVGKLSENIEDMKIYACGKATGMGDRYAEITGSNYKGKIYYLYSGDEVELTVRGKIKEGTQNQKFTNLIEIYTDDVRGAGYNFSYVIQANHNLVKQNANQDNGTESKYYIAGSVCLKAEQTAENVITEMKAPSEVEVQLLKDGDVAKTTTTDALGNYIFEDLDKGDYTLALNYDKEKYTTADLSKEMSNLIEIQEGMAVTDTISITESSINNVTSYLKEKEKFDLSMKQYISKATVIVDEKEKEYDYADLELAKLEINPSKIEDAIVKLEYKLFIENVGNVEGQVTSIVDYVPNGLTFNETENPDWAIGVNGNLYTDALKDITIKPGEGREITLILTKKMTEDNTGVVSNKAKIAYTESTTRLTEGKSNNFATQETIVTLTQGGIFANPKVGAIFTISMMMIVGIFGYMVQTGRIEITLNTKNGIKKIYR